MGAHPGRQAHPYRLPLRPARGRPAPGGGDHDGARDPPPRLRRRGLRPHPQGRDPGDRRRALLQRRRLGREFDGLGGAL